MATLRLSTLCCLLLLLVLGGGRAARAERTLTLGQALALARHNNLDLEAARARLEQASTQVRRAWVALLPQLTAQGRYTHNYKEVTLDLSQQSAAGLVTAESIADLYSQTGKTPPPQLAAAQQGLAAELTAQPLTPIVIQRQEQLDGTLALTVPLVVPFAYPALTGAKHGYRAAHSSFRVDETTVLYSVAQSYYAAAGADELVRARRHAIGVAQTTLDNARARLAAGVVNRVEVARAQVALLRAQQALAEAKDTQAQTYRALGTLIQLRQPFVVVPEPEGSAAVPPVAELAKDALRLRPEFNFYQQNIEAERDQVRANALRWLPTLSGFGNLHGFNYAGFSGDQYAWALGLQLDWVLYDGGTRDVDRHLAAAQAQESVDRLTLLRETVVDDLENASQALKTKRSAVETARRSMALSQETLSLVRIQHDAGTATQLDLLQAQDSLVASEVSLAQSRFDLALARLQLERAAGTFPPPGKD